MSRGHYPGNYMWNVDNQPFWPTRDPHPEAYMQQGHPANPRTPPFPGPPIPPRSPHRPGPWHLSSHMDPGPSQRRSPIPESSPDLPPWPDTGPRRRRRPSVPVDYAAASGNISSASSNSSSSSTSPSRYSPDHARVAYSRRNPAAQSYPPSSAPREMVSASGQDPAFSDGLDATPGQGQQTNRPVWDLSDDEVPKREPPAKVVPPTDSSRSADHRGALVGHGRSKVKAVWELLDEDSSGSKESKELPVEKPTVGTKLPGPPVWTLGFSEQSKSEASKLTSNVWSPKTSSAISLPASSPQPKEREKVQTPTERMSAAESLATEYQSDLSSMSQKDCAPNDSTPAPVDSQKRLPSQNLGRSRTKSEPRIVDTSLGASEPQNQYVVGDNPVIDSLEDIRCPPSTDGRKFAIRPGALVICVNDTLYRKEQEDHTVFKLRHGDAYIVVRVYGDRWASCVKLSLTEPVQPAFPTKGLFGRKDYRMAWPDSCDNVGFLPLCSVTLIGNFSGYQQRRNEVKKESPREFHTGLVVIPPERTYSMEFEQQVINGGGIRLPRELFNIVKLHDARHQEPYQGNKAFLAREIGYGSKAKPPDYVASSVEWPGKLAWRWGYIRYALNRQSHRLTARLAGRPS